jgi:hypothetical protein
MWNEFLGHASWELQTSRCLALPNPSCRVGVEQLQIWYISWGFWWWCMAFVLFLHFYLIHIWI